jgi:hypothetical protein
VPRIAAPGMGVLDVPDHVPIDQVKQAVSKWYQKSYNDLVPDAFPEAQRTDKMIVDRLPTLAEWAGLVQGLVSTGVTPPKWLPEMLGGGSTKILSPEGRKAVLPVKFGTLTPDEQTKDVNLTTMHEAAHTIWDELTDEEREKWRAIHKRNPDAFGEYYRNRPDHAFAEGYGMYATDRKGLQKSNPEAYRFLKNKTQFEYAQPGESMTPR